MIILTGPKGSEKIAAEQCISHILMVDCVRCQLKVGHPQKFKKSENQATFTQVYTRHTTEKLRWLIEEAWLPENMQRAFIACLTYIIPAELLTFFIELAAHFKRGKLCPSPDFI